MDNKNSNIFLVKYDDNAYKQFIFVHFFCPGYYE